jgi:hypothetical protein
MTVKDLKAKEERVNALLREVKVRVGRRYDYVAIDMTDDEGKVLDTLAAGLTSREAFTILDCLENVLRRELSC